MKILDKKIIGRTPFLLLVIVIFIKCLGIFYNIDNKIMIRKR